MSKGEKILAWFFSLLLFLLPAACFCSEPKLQQYQELFQRVGRHFDIPWHLLEAIARQESDLELLAVNVAGKDHHPRSLSEAMDLVRRAEARNLSYDVGLMQINRQWIRKYKLDPELLFKAGNNIFLGAAILAQEIRRVGLSWKAVGHYHSHTPWRAEDYARRVRRKLSSSRR